MIWQRARLALLANVLLATAAVSARADYLAPVPATGAAAPVASTVNPCAPAMQSVTEWVPQNYTTTQTVYRMQCVPQTFTAYKTVCVPQTCTRVCTVNRMVPSVQTVVRTVCVPTPCVQTCTVMKRVVTCKPVTTMTCKCVDMGHYECRCVPCRQGCLAKMRNKHNCCCQCVPMKTVRVWCPNKVMVQTPCTKMVRCVQCVPCTTQVTVCKMVPKQITCQVCCYRCVPQQITQCYTVMTAKCVPYQCTRMVAQCVPCQQTVTCCRMVPCVRQVPCGNAGGNVCCNSGCNSGCNVCCNTCRGHGHKTCCKKSRRCRCH